MNIDLIFPLTLTASGIQYTVMAHSVIHTLKKLHLLMDKELVNLGEVLQSGGTVWDTPLGNGHPANLSLCLCD